MVLLRRTVVRSVEVVDCSPKWIMGPDSENRCQENQVKSVVESIRIVEPSVLMGIDIMEEIELKFIT